MSFPAYPQYKDSGIESLGDIPSHWDVTRLPYVIFENNAGEVIDKNFWGDGSELLYTCAKQPLLSDYKDFPARKRTGANDLLLTRNGTPYVHLPSEGAIYSNVVQRVSLMPGVDRKFMRSALDVATRDLVGYGVSIASFNYEMWAALRIPLPDYDEQTQIARFLGHETARIDALIEEQQRLIELLKEKRQAVISHAVTKGLDPTVPMKDSGVEWLGEVPAHWQVKRLKHLVPSITVGIVVEPSKYYVDDGVPALRSLNVKPGVVVTENLVYLSEESNELHAKSKIFEGDIVAVRSGQPGTAAIVPKEFNGANCIDLIVIRKPLQGCSTFIFWYLNSDAALRQFSEGSSGAIQQHFNIAAASEMVFAWPPASEQLEINSHLDRACHQLDRLISVAGESKSLLLERRSALISAAVTGKIDVRGWQPAASTQAPEPAVAEAV
ncbi:restriction endonuclease subunit S [Stutzerimonas degradans]|uniref:restriction endonuclease subunit S n=1 Tax=Stutzerimonas degradans TaxID=2968968 RepID=UPI001F3A43EE|nr:restriction endonuclease subunit S [Stutzerimonas degradans]MCF6751174.1 restriction endonuclease subunit S [Stutzerimonas stutzeri]